MPEKEEEGSEMHTKVAPCNCTGKGSLQIHLSRPATAFLVALLDRKNPVFWDKQEPESVEMIENFGKMLSLDIKHAITRQRKIERMDEEKYNKLQADLEGPDIVMAVGDIQLAELLSILMGPLDKLN
jgi:hypothetical protein